LVQHDRLGIACHLRALVGQRHRSA
jgi:hypothetical protein